MALKTYNKDPSAILDYGIDWTAWLDNQTIVNSSWSLQGDGALDVLANTHTGTVAMIKFGGGNVGSKYIATNHIITNTALEDSRRINIRVVER